MKDYGEYITTIIQDLPNGEIFGTEMIAKMVAKEYGLKCHRFPADWEKHGKSAGYIRNKEMAEFSDVIIAFWDGKSKGTKHMIDISVDMNKKVYVINV